MFKLLYGEITGILQSTNEILSNIAVIWEQANCSIREY